MSKERTDFMLELREDLELKEMNELCQFVKERLGSNEYKVCEERICQAMALYPSAPEPHNLFGIIAQMKGCHSLAMKHFRVALDLLPTYRPASQNLRIFGELFGSIRLYAFSEVDCLPVESDERKAHVERIF